MRGHAPGDREGCGPLIPPLSETLRPLRQQVFERVRAAGLIPRVQVAKELERIALEDPYFIEKKLYPNVDFYTGVIYKAMGFPEKMFTVLFALGRLPGWIAQWRELMEDPATKIGRPRQLYIGATQRDYVDVENR